MELSLNAIIVFSILIALLQSAQLSARPQSSEIDDMKKSLFSACNAKYPITEEMINNAKKGIFSEDRNFKCVTMCFMDELSLIDEEGVIDGEAMIAMAPDSIKLIMEQSINTCLPDIGGKPDSCEVAYNFLLCSTKLNPKMLETIPV